MRQVRTKDLNFSYIVLGFSFLFYEILTSVFNFLPLLYGFFFCYAFILLKERERTLLKLDFRWYFSLAFLLFTDITHDFALFSSWLAFFIFYYALADWIKTNLKVANFAPIIFVLSAYVFIFILDLVFSYASNENLNIIRPTYIIPLCVEALLAYVFFREKI